MAASQSVTSSSEASMFHEAIETPNMLHAT